MLAGNGASRGVGAGRNHDQVRPVGADAVDGRLDAGPDRHVELLQRRDPIGPHARDVFLVGRRQREVHLAAGLGFALPYLDLMAVGREHARGFESGDAAADHEHAGILLFDSGKPRLEPRQRLEFGAHQRVLDAGDIELKRQPFEADVARDAMADRPLHLAESLEAPMRVGDQRPAQRDVVGAAGLQHAFGVLGRQHPARHDDRYAHRILDRPRMRFQEAARK